MTHVSRRHFIQKSALAAGATIALSQLPKELFAGAKLADMPLGFQTWVVKDQIGKDFAGTTKMLSDLGYTLAEMCSPKGYGGGFEPLGKVKPSELKKMFNGYFDKEGVGVLYWVVLGNPNNNDGTVCNTGYGTRDPINGAVMKMIKGYQFP